MSKNSNLATLPNVDVVSNDELQAAANNLLCSFDQVHLLLEGKISAIVGFHDSRKFPLAKHAATLALEFVTNELVKISDLQEKFVLALDKVDDLALRNELLSINLKKIQSHSKELESTICRLKDETSHLEKVKAELQENKTEVSGLLDKLDLVRSKSSQRIEELELTVDTIKTTHIPLEVHSKLQEELALVKNASSKQSSKITEQSQTIGQLTNEVSTLKNKTKNQEKNISRLKNKVEKKPKTVTQIVQKPSDKSQIIKIGVVDSTSKEAGAPSQFYITKLPIVLPQVITNIGLGIYDAPFTIMVSDDNGCSINCVISEWLTPIMPYHPGMSNGWSLEIEQMIHNEVKNLLRAEYPKYVKAIDYLKRIKIEPFVKRGMISARDYDLLKKANIENIFQAVANSYHCFVRGLNCFKPVLTQEEYSDLFYKLNTIARLNFKNAEKLPLITQS